jgi:multidrug resistance protein
LARIVPSGDATTTSTGAARTGEGATTAPPAVDANHAGDAAVKQTRRGLVLAFLMTTMALGSIEGTIVATAMPSIVATLGGFELYSWVFASYLLTQAVFTPISGAVADRVGRKPVLMVSVVLFLAASVACGLAGSMRELIAFRFLQGVGAAGFSTMVVTLAGDLYTVRERGRIQAYLASVWGVSSVLGPLLGGLIVANVDWAWVFWFNVPFGLVAVVGIGRFLRERVARAGAKVDIPGSLLLLVSVSGLMVLLNMGGRLEPSLRWPLLALTVAASVVLGLYLRRRQGGVLPVDLWRDRLILLANLSAFVAGVVMISVISYAPPYVQGVMGYAPLVAGFALSTMSIGWPIASSLTGRVLIPLGPANTARLGAAAGVLGGLLYLFLRPERGPVWVGVASFCIGLAMGAINTASIVTIQASVSWDRRGSATAANLLMRLVGNSVGAALLGGVLNAAVIAGIARAGAQDTLDLASVESLLNPAEAAVNGTALAPAAERLLQSVLAGGIERVFDVTAVGTLLLFGMTLLWPRSRRLEG